MSKLSFLEKKKEKQNFFLLSPNRISRITFCISWMPCGWAMICCRGFEYDKNDSTIYCLPSASSQPKIEFSTVFNQKQMTKKGTSPCWVNEVHKKMTKELWKFISDQFSARENDFLSLSSFYFLYFFFIFTIVAIIWWLSLSPFNDLHIRCSFWTIFFCIWF